MGSNNAKVVNKTKKRVTILVFSNSNLVEWHYRTLRIVPPGGDVEISGLAGGGAVKVGIVYDMYEEDKYVFVMVRLPENTTLHIEEIDSTGVRCTLPNGGSVEVLKKGQTIQKDANAQEGTKFWMGATLGVVMVPVTAVVSYFTKKPQKN